MPLQIQDDPGRSNLIELLSRKGSRFLHDYMTTRLRSFDTHRIVRSRGRANINHIKLII